jgi:cell division septum initiation protein DivIVA
MSGFRDKGFGDRLSTAQNARKAMLERVRAKSGADDPAVAERRAARQAVSTAREVRLAEREAAEREVRQAAEHEQRLVQEANEAVESACSRASGYAGSRAKGSPRRPLCRSKGA